MFQKTEITCNDFAVAKYSNSGLGTYPRETWNLSLRCSALKAYAKKYKMIRIYHINSLFNIADIEDLYVKIELYVIESKHNR